MLYEFKSKAAGSVVMLGPVAERLLAVVGKEPGPKGVFTVEQMGPAIAALEVAVAREKAELAELAARGWQPEDGNEHEPDPDERARRAAQAVTLGQRAWPLIDLLKTARAAEQVVTWGV
jgi:hypothetical protein